MTTQEIPPFLRFRVYLGHEIRPDRRRYETETVDVARAAEMVAAEFPDGFTQYGALGRWRDKETGRVVSEPSTVFEILTGNVSGFETARVDSLARALKAEFRQDSVMVTAEPVPVVDFV